MNKAEKAKGSCSSYVCKNCRRIFECGKGWYNAFYCGSWCAAAYNACGECGKNRYLECECKNEI